MFSSAGAQPISLKSFRGLGHFHNKIAQVYKHEHCLPSAFRSWQVMRSGYRRALLAGMASSGVGTHRICLLFCKEIPVVPRRISQVYIHLLCLLFSVSHDSKRHFPNGNRRQPPPCLPKSETDGRKSMAAQPFILTIDESGDSSAIPYSIGLWLNKPFMNAIIRILQHPASRN